MRRMTDQEKLWRANYLLRVLYKDIPGTPEDQITFTSLMRTLYKTSLHLGPLYDDEGRLIGYNDVENYLNPETGLVTNTQYRQLRQVKYSQQKQYEYSQRDEVMIQLRIVGTNDLQFEEDDYVDMTDWAISISQAAVSEQGLILGNKRFPSIYRLLRSTILPEPETERAFPRAKVLHGNAYERFLKKCPPYMDSYKHKLVKRYTNE